jgi:hypothetical protein
MTKSLTSLCVDRLKRKAKRIAKSAAVPLHEAQLQVARSEGFSSWEILQRSAARHVVAPNPCKPTRLKPDANGCIGPALAAHIEATCIEFINGLDEDEVFRACWSGSIWISLDHVENGTVGVNSFAALGSRHDGIWQQIGYADGMVPLLDLDGLAEMFVLEDDEDDDGEPVVPDGYQVMYDVDVGRAELLRAARAVDGEVAGVEAALFNRRSQD